VCAGFRWGNLRKRDHLGDPGVDGRIILRWVFKKNELGRACSTCVGEKRCTQHSEGKRPLGRPRCRWEDNIKMDLQEVGCGDMDWIELAQGRDRWRELVNAVMNLLVP